MILAAGLGTRMRPLSDLCAKPALPVRGKPVIAYLLEWLAQHDVREVMINLHHLPESIVTAVERHGPKTVHVEYSREEAPLGTGGGIRRVRDFLAESDPSVVVAGDMLFDADLGRLARAHRQRGVDCTLLLRDDPRHEQFGTIGLDAGSGVTRIGRRFDLGGESQAGVFVGVRLFSPSIFRALPDRPVGDAFEDLSDWLAPAIRAGTHRVIGDRLSRATTAWEPVGTPAVYLAVNLSPPTLQYPPPTFHVAKGTKVIGRDADVIVGAGAHVGREVELARCVIWEGERIPDGSRAHGGVFAGGKFYACENDPE
jgi:NDP-sugar pyrophosphorylase family protein